MFSSVRHWYWKKVYRPGRVVTRFVARDIRRDAEVLDTSRLGDGLLTGRVRTWNVLHAVRGLSPMPVFGEVRVMTIREMWAWSGPSWGGPVPAERQDAEPPAAPDHE